MRVATVDKATRSSPRPVEATIEDSTMLSRLVPQANSKAMGRTAPAMVGLPTLVRRPTLELMAQQDILTTRQQLPTLSSSTVTTRPLGEAVLS